MSFDTLRKAVIDQFDASWSGSQVSRGGNDDFDPPSSGTWVRIQVVPFGSENADVGGTLHRTIGEIVVQCFAPAKSGEKALLDMVDEVTSIFQNKTFNGVECFATSLVRVGASGDWYQFNANTEFKYDVYQ